MEVNSIFGDRLETGRSHPCSIPEIDGRRLSALIVLRPPRSIPVPVSAGKPEGFKIGDRQWMPRGIFQSIMNLQMTIYSGSMVVIKRSTCRTQPTSNRCGFVMPGIGRFRIIFWQRFFSCGAYHLRGDAQYEHRVVSVSLHSISRKRQDSHPMLPTECRGQKVKWKPHFFRELSGLFRPHSLLSRREFSGLRRLWSRCIISVTAQYHFTIDPGYSCLACGGNDLAREAATQHFLRQRSARAHRPFDWKNSGNQPTET
jgi:hypothetical protein